MSVQFKEINYSIYGRCLEMSNELCRLVITLDKGPHIICYQMHGEPNVMFEDLEDFHTQSGSDFDTYFYPGAKWHIYGGHRLWLSPESMPETYYPDNFAVPYTTEGNTVILTPKEQEGNHVQYVFKVTLEEKGTKVTVAHTIYNRDSKEKTFAPWGLSVLAPGGVEIVPQADKQTGLLSNRILALWDYSDMSDPRLWWGNKYITLIQIPGMDKNFKLGLNHEKQWSSYLLGKELFVKRYHTVDGGNYPDGGCSFETYICKNFLEMESLGELKTLAPGESVDHVENWELSVVEGGFDPKDEASVDGFAKKYLW